MSVLCKSLCFCSLSLPPHPFSLAKQQSAAGPVATFLEIKSIYPQLSGPLVTDGSNPNQALSHSPGPAPPFSFKGQPGRGSGVWPKVPHVPSLLPVPSHGSGLLLGMFWGSSSYCPFSTPEFQSLIAPRLVGCTVTISFHRCRVKWLAAPGSSLQQQAHITDPTRRLIFPH